MYTLLLNPDSEALCIISVQHLEYLHYCTAYPTPLHSGTRSACWNAAEEYWSTNFVEEDRQMCLIIRGK